MPELDLGLNADLSLPSFMDVASVITLLSLGVVGYRNTTYLHRGVVRVKKCLIFNTDNLLKFRRGGSLKSQH